MQDRHPKLNITRSAHRVIGVVMALFMTAQSTAAAADEEVSAMVAKHLDVHGSTMVEEFAEFLRLPNVSTNLDHMQKNADWIVDYIGKRGFTSEIVYAGRAPYIIAERSVENAQATVLIYAHFDGQPVEPDNWATPPFEPTLKSTPGINQTTLPWSAMTAPDMDWRIYARSAGDDKAPLIALMHAIDALRADGKDSRVNIKLFLDGEEEFGSPTLAEVLVDHANKLDADLMLFCDGPMHQSGRRQLVFGVRGDIGVDLTTYGANRPLHSGHYGNWSPHPTDAMMRLLTSLKDSESNILVKGYLDEVLPVTPAELTAISAMPLVDDTLKHSLQLGRTESNGERIELAIMKPAINVVGFDAGGVGDQARNILLPTSRASLDLRLVPAQTVKGVKNALESHIADAGFHIVREEPTAATLRRHPSVIKVNWTSGYPAYRSDLSGPAARKLAEILTRLEGQAPLMTPTMGGSLPIYRFDQVLDMPIVLLPIANHDNNQHGRDENIRLGNLYGAVGVFAALLTEFSQ